MSESRDPFVEATRVEQTAAALYRRLAHYFSGEEGPPGSPRRITLDLIIPPRKTGARRGKVVATAPGKGIRRPVSRSRSVSLDDILIVLDNRD